MLTVLADSDPPPPKAGRFPQLDMTHGRPSRRRSQPTSC